MVSLAEYSDLESAVITSLASEKRFESTAGYWADALDGGEFGSHLWRLRRSVLTKDTIVLAEQYARESLGWLIHKGLASDIDVSGVKENEKLILKITLDKEVNIDYAV